MISITREDPGESEYRKAIDGRRKWYAGNPAGGTSDGCRRCAGYAGAMAALSLRIIEQGHARSDAYFERHRDDAVMYAVMAFRAWRAYRSFGKD